MAGICATLTSGLDNSCPEVLTRKYYQDMVVINADHIDTTTIVKDLTATHHSVEFSLKTGKTGYKFILPESGGSVFGSFDKTTNESFGTPQYVHKMNYAVIGADELTKSVLRTLDKGSFIVAARIKGTNIVEIFGIDNGLVNADYTFDLVGGSGGSVLVLQSMENAPETHIPFVYKSADPIADFDLAFAN